MEISEFKYKLPKELIAQYPTKERGTSKLLVLDRTTGNLKDDRYFNIPNYIKEGDIVVLNNTKVINSRTFFLTSIGKRVEVLFLEEREDKNWFVLIGRAKDVQIGEILRNEEDKKIKIGIEEREKNGFLIKFLKGDSDNLFDRYGHTPLPPYIKREDEESDKERYNTIFSSAKGAVAAPTASLNLTENILQEIKLKGVEIVNIELKVGWGTFAPIREENIKEHQIHKEYIDVGEDVANKINNCKGRVWAFGTTVARALESVVEKDKVSDRYKVVPFEGNTDLFIYPGYKWKVVDVLVTNFHMPSSTLILLVSSFGRVENIKIAYNYAIKKGYKLLSYGDSMLIGDNLIK